MRLTLFLGAWAVGLLAGPSAFALETGQCAAAATIRSALATEGQNTVIIGNRSGAGIPTTLAFTSNADGSKGYMILGDKPLGERADWICVESVYRDVRLNDVTKPGVPAWALYTGDPKRVDAMCAGQKLGWQGACGLHNTVVENHESHGQRVLFKATGTAKSRDGLRQDQLLLVMIDTRENAGGLTATTTEGANYMLWAYSKMALTPFASALTR